MKIMKIIYISPPKTATRTIRDALKLDVKFDHCIPPEIIKEIGKEEWDNSFKFSFIRNPYDRLVSFYHFAKTNHPYFYNKYTFKEWVMNDFPTTWKLHDDIFPYLEDDIKKYGNYDTPYYQLKFTNYITDDLDFIGRFENLNNDIEEVGKLSGIEIKKISHLNKSNRTQYKSYYDEESIEKVKEIFGDDLEKFGYKF